MSKYSGEIEKIKNISNRIMPFICEYWNLEREDALSNDEINFLTVEEFNDIFGLGSEQYVTPDNEYFGTYTENGESYLYAEFNNIENGVQLIPSEIGEELSHIAHQRAGNSSSQHLDLSMDSDIEDYRAVDIGDWLKTSSVSEFIGRLGGINTSIEFGGDLPEKEPELLDTNDVDLTAREMYEHVKQKDLASMKYPNVWDTVIHDTGYRTAEKNIQKANRESDLIYEDPENIWDDYNMEEQIVNSIEKIWDL